LEFADMLDKMPKPVVLEHSVATTAALTRIVSIIAVPAVAVQETILSAIEAIAQSQRMFGLFVPAAAFVLEAIIPSASVCTQDRAKPLVAHIERYAIEVRLFPSTAPLQP
jgi:hypothetical protein